MYEASTEAANGGHETGGHETKGRDAGLVCTYGGYEIRVHFSGERTLAQCLRCLAEREMEEFLQEK